MAGQNLIKFSREEVELAIFKAKTMRGASHILGINDRTFKRIASEYGIYHFGGEGAGKKLDLQEILEGKHPQYPTSKLSKRLVREGIKEYRCEKCGITEWCGNKISLELDHVDGNSKNHKLSNLRLLCPNCHSQTPTFRNKRRLDREV